MPFCSIHDSSGVEVSELNGTILSFIVFTSAGVPRATVEHTVLTCENYFRIHSQKGSSSQNGRAKAY